MLSIVLAYVTCFPFSFSTTAEIVIAALWPTWVFHTGLMCRSTSSGCRSQKSSRSLVTSTFIPRGTTVTIAIWSDWHARIPSDSVWVFVRHFHGSDFHTHIKAIREGKVLRDQPYFEEVVVVDLAEKILSGESIQNMFRSVCRYADKGTAGFRVVRPLALAEDESVYLLSAMNGAGGAQEYQIHRAARNSQGTDPESLELLFNAGDMCIFNCIFAKGCLFALAAKADGESN